MSAPKVTDTVGFEITPDHARRLALALLDRAALVEVRNRKEGPGQSAKVCEGARIESGEFVWVEFQIKERA